MWQLSLYLGSFVQNSHIPRSKTIGRLNFGEKGGTLLYCHLCSCEMKCTVRLTIAVPAVTLRDLSHSRNLLLYDMVSAMCTVWLLLSVYREDRNGAYLRLPGTLREDYWDTSVQTCLFCNSGCLNPPWLMEVVVVPISDRKPRAYKKYTFVYFLTYPITYVGKRF